MAACDAIKLAYLTETLLCPWHMIFLSSCRSLRRCAADSGDIFFERIALPGHRLNRGRPTNRERDGTDSDKLTALINAIRKFQKQRSEDIRQLVRGVQAKGNCCERAAGVRSDAESNKAWLAGSRWAALVG